MFMQINLEKRVFIKYVAQNVNAQATKATKV